MWKSLILDSSDHHLTFRLKADEALSHRQFLTLLSENSSFISWYNQFLANSDYDAFFWENKPVTKDTLDDDYECTLVKSTTLAHVKPDQGTFNSYFEHDKNAVSFPNLGGDAQLVAPCPVSSDRTLYSQIGSFIRHAPDNQIIDFWQLVGREMLVNIQSDPRWLSTSGLGVYWLHVRIDSVPKYYQTDAYKLDLPS